MSQETSHLSTEALAAFLSRRVDASEQAAIEAHLAGCPGCRAELTAAHRARAQRDRPKRLATRIAAAAAVLAVVAVGLRSPPPAPEPGSPVFRSAESAAMVQTRTPAAGAYVSREQLRFGWAAAGPDFLYRVFVLDSAGAELWRAESSDTVVAPGADLRLVPEVAYTWYVDAVGPSGDSVSSGPVSFGVR
jgi:hypothetical protein